MKYITSILFVGTKVLYTYITAGITSPFLSPHLVQVKESTHEQPFLISYTFKKCQKCFMGLV